MKQYLYLLVGLLMSSSLLGQDTPRKIETAVSQVKIHLQGAYITRKITLELPKGRQELIFTGLSPKLMSETIRMMTSVPLDILSITSKTNFLDRNKGTAEIMELQDSVKAIKRSINLLDSRINAHKEQKQLLKKNQIIKGSNQNLSIEELDLATEFFFNRMQKINEKVFELEGKLEGINRRLFDYKLQLHELNANRQPLSEIYIVVETEKALETDIELTYLVSDAGWAANYDLYAGEIGKPIRVKYRALAYNNTGVDWNQVKLVLSTADPIQSATQPELEVWSLSRYNNNVNYNQQTNGVETQDLNPYRGNVFVELDLDEPLTEEEQNIAFIQSILGNDYKGNVDYNTKYYQQYIRKNKPTQKIATQMINLPDLNAEFEIEKAYTLPSDNRPYSIYISQSTLNCSYEYVATPKLDLSAYLVTKIIDWEDLNFISGKVNLYNKNEYIGQSYLDTRSINDTLFVSLGKDPAIIVSRMKVKGSKKKVFLGSAQKSEIAYNITIKNNKNTPIDILLEDHIPISDDKDIVITLNESSGAEYQEEIGLLSWKATLAPNESKTYTFGFSVKHPKDKKVAFRFSGKGRRMGCPTF